MFEVRNKEDLRLAYSLLREKTRQGLTSAQDDYRVQMIKREIRRYLNRPMIDERKLVKDDGDRAIILYPLPEALSNTYKAAHKHFMDCEYISLSYPGYDCSGQPFTAWFKLFRRHNRWYVYHCICLDC